MQFFGMRPLNALFQAQKTIFSLTLIPLIAHSETIDLELSVPPQEIQSGSLSATNSVLLDISGSYHIPTIDPEEFEILEVEAILRPAGFSAAWDYTPFKESYELASFSNLTLRKFESSGTSDLVPLLGGGENYVGSSPRGISIGWSAVISFPNQNLLEEEFYSEEKKPLVLLFDFVNLATAGSGANSFSGAVTFANWGKLALRYKLRRISPLAEIPGLPAPGSPSRLSSFEFDPFDLVGVPLNLLEGDSVSFVPDIIRDLPISTKSRFDRQDNTLEIEFHTDSGTNYELHFSKKIQGTSSIVDTLSGDGNNQTFTVSLNLDEPKGFYWITARKAE